MARRGFSNCPICGNKLKHIDFYESYMLVEEHEDCSNCGYSYCFSYGQYELSFGKYVFYWSHGTSFNKYVRLQRKIHNAIFMSRRNFRKGCRRNFHVCD